MYIHVYTYELICVHLLSKTFPDFSPCPEPRIQIFGFCAGLQWLSVGAWRHGVSRGNALIVWFQIYKPYNNGSSPKPYMYDDEPRNYVSHNISSPKP